MAKQCFLEQLYWLSVDGDFSGGGLPTMKPNDDTTFIVHNVSGPETFARMDVAGRTTDFTLGEIEGSVAVQDGESKYDARPVP